jgi:hypothetical protein
MYTRKQPFVAPGGAEDYITRKEDTMFRKESRAPANTSAGRLYKAGGRGFKEAEKRENLCLQGEKEDEKTICCFTVWFGGGVVLGL